MLGVTMSGENGVLRYLGRRRPRGCEVLVAGVHRAEEPGVSKTSSIAVCDGLKSLPEVIKTTREQDGRRAAAHRLPVSVAP